MKKLFNLLVNLVVVFGLIYLGLITDNPLYKTIAFGTLVTYIMYTIIYSIGDYLEYMSANINKTLDEVQKKR